MVPPSGQVTLLFTDIEGSTRLWERDPQVMSTALARHDTLLRSHIEAHGGHVFKTVGDAFIAVFADAADAAASVIAAQRAIEHEPWPDATPIRVRMALHSGVCVERNGDYFGPVVNRAARLLAVGHGGQILMSAATTELSRNKLPADADVTDLGVHRLKDLSQPEQVYQLHGPGLASSFASLRSLDDPTLRHNLPYQATPLVGRTAEVAKLRSLVEGGARVTTLTGAGGVGKTRLALQVAAELVDGTGDGVWLVELASLTEPEFVARAVASVFGVRDQADRPVADAVVNALANRYLLLVLDNAEHLLEATASLVELLVRSCPRVSVLVTSREPLGVNGEHVFRTPSLSVPPASTQSHDQIASYESVQLFAERAALHRPGFRLDDTDVVALAELCKLLDGIPLAIELAAARLGSMTVSEIKQHLDSRFSLLTAGRRGSLPRHQTLGALIDWSYALLAPDEQILLSRLSVFAGGWTLEAACVVCSDRDLDQTQVVLLLAALVDKSLVQADSDGAATRYRLLETVRWYARDRLTALGEDEQARTLRAHRSFYLDLAEAGEPELHGPDQVGWLDTFEAEHDNFRAALASFLDEPGAALLGLRLCLALQWFWEVRGHYLEGTSAVEALLALPELQAPSLERARALNEVCHVGARLSTNARSVARAQEALAIAQTLHDSAVAADALYHLYWHEITHAGREAALAYAEAGLVAASDSGQARLVARHLMARAVSRGEHSGELVLADAAANDELVREYVALARADFHRALAMSRQSGDHERVLCTLINLSVGECSWGVHGDIAAAAEMLAEAAPLARGTQNPDLLSMATIALAEMKIRNGDFGQAHELLVSQLVEDDRAGRRSLLWTTFLALVTVQGDSDHERRAVLYGVAEGLREELGREYFVADQIVDAQAVQDLRAALGSEAYEAAVARGKAMSVPEAIALATGRAPSP